MTGENAVSDDPKAVIEGIEEDLNEALSKLDRAERTIEQTQRKLAILKSRDDMPGDLE